MSKPIEIDVKRFYLPFVVTATCPLCRAEVERRLDDQYLSYPETGRNSLSMYHESCNASWDVEVDLQLTLTAVSGCTVREQA
jgi:hypothetical protein